MDRLERLVNLLVALLDTRRPLTREELRERVGGYSDDPASFRRNFERDKDLLRRMGIPVLTEKLGPPTPEEQAGYWVPRELYEMPDPGLTEEELMALSLAASLVALGGTAGGAAGSGAGESATATTALRKLAGAGSEAPVDSGDGSGSLAGGAGVASPPSGRPVVDLPLGPEVAALFAGVAERRVVSFTYNEVVRTVDPYRLSYRDGRWYLAGFDHARAAERLFRVDRVVGPVELVGGAGAFDRPSGAPVGPPPPWRLGDEEPVVVDLRVDESQAAWVRRLAGREALVRTGPGGEAYFRLQVTNRDAFRGFVLGLLEHAEVVSPPAVRDGVIAWLEAVATGGTA